MTPAILVACMCAPLSDILTELISESRYDERKKKIVSKQNCGSNANFQAILCLGRLVSFESALNVVETNSLYLHRFQINTFH